MAKVIYLEVDEEITSVIDKIKKVEDKQISLFFPKRANLIKSIVNLKLLKRQADLLSKEIIIVTTDETGANLAKKSDFKVIKELKDENDKIEKVNFVENKEDKSKLNIEKFLNSDDIEKTDADQQENNVLSKKEIEPSADTQKNKEPLFSKSFNKKKESKKKKARKSKSGKIVLLPSFGVKSFLVFCLISFIIVGIIFFVVLPKAKIKVIPKTEPFSNELEVSAVKDFEGVDYEGGIIGGNIKNLEVKSDKEEFEATGEKDVGEKAKGNIILYNDYSSNPQILVASTRFQSQGKTFYSLVEVTIPGARIENGKKVPGEVEVLVEAEKSGESYNIGPSNFVIPGLAPERQNDIYGKSKQSFSGGTSKKIKIVSEEDLTKAKDNLLDKASKKGIEELEKEIGKDKIFIESTARKEITEIKTNGEVDKEASSFEMEVKVSVWIMEINKDNLKSIVFADLKKDIPQEKFFINESIDEGVSYENKNFDLEHGKLDFKVKVNKLVAWQLDENLIKKSIKGKTSDEVRKYMLENSSIRNVNVSFWPFWVKKVPQIEKKIEIILDTSEITDKIVE